MSQTLLAIHTGPRGAISRALHRRARKDHLAVLGRLVDLERLPVSTRIKMTDGPRKRVSAVVWKIRPQVGFTDSMKSADFPLCRYEDLRLTPTIPGRLRWRNP
jgi:hypothetical protein